MRMVVLLNYPAKENVDNIYFWPTIEVHRFMRFNVIDVKSNIFLMLSRGST